MIATPEQLRELKVGDVVRCTAIRGCLCLNVGKEYTITQETGQWGGPYFKCRDVGSPHPVSAGEFEIVSTAGPW